MPHAVPGMVLLARGVLRAVLGMRAVSDLDVVETLAKINASCAHCNFRRMLTLTCAVRCVLHVANLVCAHARAPDPNRISPQSGVHTQWLCNSAAAP
jgi:hypothetical protein